jgi:hypothetical protein
VRLKPRLAVCVLLIASCRAEALPHVGARVPPASQAFSPSDRSSWIALKDSGFAPPAGASTSDILAAVEPLVGSRDPVLRDEVAYGLAVAWIYRERRVPDEAIRAFAARLRAHLTTGPGGDAVLRRSFSALLLSLVAASDLKAPVLEDDERTALVTAACDFLRQEPDTRGYEPGIGWVHATAHAADLLKFLARGPRLRPAEQRQMADALLARIDRPGPVFTWGEDERLAAALRSLVMRADFDPAPLDAWMAALEPAWATLWTTPALDTAAYARLWNAKHVLLSLFASLPPGGEAAPAVRAFADRAGAALKALQ